MHDNRVEICHELLWYSQNECIKIIDVHLKTILFNFKLINCRRIRLLQSYTISFVTSNYHLHDTDI